MVYRQASDDTRDFIGYINRIASRWVVTGVAMPEPGKRTAVKRVRPGVAWDTQDEAGKELSRLYDRYNRT